MFLVWSHIGYADYKDTNGTVTARYGKGGNGDFTDGVVRCLSSATSYTTDDTLDGIDKIYGGNSTDIGMYLEWKKHVFSRMENKDAGI